MATSSGRYFGSRVLALFFWAFCALVGLGSSSPCDALSPELSASFKRHLETIIRNQPRYVWGGAEAEQKGLDCSGYLFLAAKRAAIPGIKRTTAFEMARGGGGWRGVDVFTDRVFSNIEELDIPFWTWPSSPGRPYGHVGAFLVGDNGLLEVTHASQTQGHVVLVEFAGPLVWYLTKVRRLTIGNKP